MQAQLLAHLFLRGSLLMLLLTANVAAPFRTATGRPLLDCLRSALASQSVARVRIVAHVGAPGGFRAVVGLAKGGADQADLKTPARPLDCLVRSSTSSHVAPLFGPVPESLRPPLRC